MSNPGTNMTPTERRAAVSLATIFSTRMLGLFMILPVFALYSDELSGATPFLIGVAIGIYGLTQGLFQIPFGMLSDRIGRKPVIFMGLAIFVVGSIVAAMSDSIIGVIVGRAMQGAGAIAAAVMALAADLTREEHRTKAMATIGVSMGISFSISLVLGPIIDGMFGISGIFWITAALALFGMVILAVVVPTPVVSRFHRDAEPVPSQFKNVLADGQLLRLDYGIFALHMILTASFVAVPLALSEKAGLASESHWMVYLGVMLIAFMGMVPFIIIAEKKRKMKQIFTGAVVVLMISLWCMAMFESSLYGMAGSLLLFFLAFNLLEASLPSLVSKIAPADKKGTAMGVYTSSQFLGAFVGGVAGGWLYEHVSSESVFYFCAIAAAIWVLLAGTMKQPRHLATHMVNVGNVSDAEAQELITRIGQISGVEEVVVIREDGVAYIKYDSKATNLDEVNEFSVAEDESLEEGQVGQSSAPGQA